MSKYLVCALALASAHAASGLNTAKIVLEDGTPPPATVRVVPDYTFRRLPGCFIYGVFGNGTVQYAVNWNSRPYDPATADVCPVTITLAGFRQTAATLRQDAVIVLKRLGSDGEGSTVSLTALNVPKDARKAYESGVVAMSQKKWAAAQADFERAVGLYPQYAPAFSDLGEVLLQQSRPEEARAAWEKALAADPAYVRPYLQITRLDLNAKRFDDAARVADRALELNPTAFPVLFLYDAVANFNLKRLDVAERSARRAIELDASHELPRAESLLASVLTTKGDRRGAIEHFRKYLELAPQAEDAEAVRRVIADLERGSAESK
jgi:tetratricopeptide (TPR) repeat protein